MCNYRIIISITILFTLLISTNAFSQSFPGKYWVQFKDKNNNPYSITRPNEYLSQRAIDRRTKQNIHITQDDLPVNPTYIDSLEKLGLIILNKSKWLNAVTVQTNDINLIDTISKISFVKTVIIYPSKGAVKEKEKASSGENSFNGTSNVFNYGIGLNQIEMLNGQVLHNYNYKGQGIIIAVLDAGFFKVDSLPAFDSIRANNQIILTKNFVDPSKSVYNSAQHGMMVLSTIAGNIPGSLVGTAPKAKFLLLQTEDAGSEYIIEEDNWVSGAEFADSAGADIISSSLGYTTFNNPAQNHTYAEMNGRSSHASIAATIAARKGMIVVNSAGNSGGNDWQYIGAPADADSIISVGAVDFNGEYAYFSSTGPTFDRRIKPNVVAKGYLAAIQAPNGTVTTGNGTSFSCPILAGLVACLWQSNPDSTNMQIINAIIRSGNKYNNPDSLLGYGIPNFALANSILRGIDKYNLSEENIISLYPNPFLDNFNIKFNSITKQTLKIELFDILGNKILNDSINSSAYTLNEYNIKGLNYISKGVYILKITTNTKTYQQKILKD